MSGGECIEWRGFGLLLLKIFALAPADAPVTGSERIELDLPSLLVTLTVGFVLSFLVFNVIYKVKKRS